MLPNAPVPRPVPGGGAAAAAAPGGNAMPMGEAPPAAAAAEQGATPEQVRAAIMTVLQRVKSLADKYGLDLGEMVASLGSARGAAPPPPVPTPQA